MEHRPAVGLKYALSLLSKWDFGLPLTDFDGVFFLLVMHSTLPWALIIDKNNIPEKPRGWTAYSGVTAGAVHSKILKCLSKFKLRP